MKFSEVKIGNEFIWLKNSEKSLKVTFDTFYDPNEDELFCISGGTLYKPDEEVQLITKCENCKWFGKNYLAGNTESISCYKLSLDIGKDDFYRSINQDPENFSCSLFEMKEG